MKHGGGLGIPEGNSIDVHRVIIPGAIMIRADLQACLRIPSVDSCFVLLYFWLGSSEVVPGLVRRASHATGLYSSFAKSD